MTKYYPAHCRVIPPVLPMTAQDIEQENPLSGKFLRYKPSNSMSGCFIACIAREVCRFVM